MSVKQNSKVPQYETVFEPCRKSGFQTVKIITKERAVYLHSKYDPVAEAQKQVQGLVVGEDTVYIVFGLGMGYQLKALISRMGDRNKIVVFEPNISILKAFKSDKSNKDIIYDERILIAQYLSTFAANIILADYYKFAISYRKNRIFVLPVYKDIYPKECGELISCVKSQVFQCLLEKNTHKIFSNIWFRCQLRNMNFLRRSYSGSALEGLYKNIPAVIVSAGPSLEKNIGLLSELRQKAVIISVDTAYVPLYNNEIAPDYVVSIDAQPIVARKFDGVDVSNIDLVTTYLSAVKVQALNFRRMVAFREFHHFLDECYEDLGINMIMLESGGSVACTALDLAYKMGADPIIFVGQDLAYTENVTHIKGTAFYRDINNEHDNTFEVAGYDGGTVLTTHNLNGYRIWIETFINVNNDRTYLNATEGGAKIHGMANVTLREAIDRYCVESYDLSAKKDLVFQPENISATPEQFIAFIGHIERAGKYLKRIVKQVDICNSLTEKIIQEIETFGFKRPERISEPYQKIKKLNKDLDENEHYVDIILPLMAMQREEATATDHLLNPGLTKEELLVCDLRKYADYYKAFSEKAKYAIPIIERNVQREKADFEKIQKSLGV